MPKKRTAAAGAGGEPTEITLAEYKAMLQGEGQSRQWNDNEHREQRALIFWARCNETQLPALALLHAIPNGGRRPPSRNRHGDILRDSKGRAVSLEAVRLKEEGVKPGIPDLHLPVARQGFHSLYIELKYGKNKTSEAQDQIIALLRAEGNRVEICYSWEAGRDALLDYMGVPVAQRSGFGF